MDKKTTGAWLIHHTAKIQQVANIPSFDKIALAGKAGILLSSLSESSQESQLDKAKVEVLARNAGISPLLELPILLTKLEDNQLISRSKSQTIQVLGLTTSTVLLHAANIFYNSEPQSDEIAVLDLAEKVSQAPSENKVISEYLSDTYKLTSDTTKDLLYQSEKIGFVDYENIDSQSKLYFNGNLFRNDNLRKTNAILSSLTSQETCNIQAIDDFFERSVTIPYIDASRILGEDLLKKLQSVGMYDVNVISNERERIAFLTKPAAFSKYGNPLVEDALDLVKAFVTSLSYGMLYSPTNRGRITMLPLLLNKLARGEWVGSATAIGQDYKILELKRVVQVRHDGMGRYSMKLLKRDVGELALQAISHNDISEELLPLIHSAKVDRFSGPEANREIVRKQWVSPSRREVGSV